MIKSFIKKAKWALWILLGCIECTQTNASPIIVDVNQGWKFREARSANWYPATVPGTVHTDLYANRLIEDPFYRLNERGLQWIDKEDWIYETRLPLTSQIREQEHVDLLMKGLDTYADIYVNDQLVGKADNMFRQWRIDVKPYLKDGNNTLRIYFHSPIKIDLPKWEALPYHYEAGNDQSENGGLLDRKLSVFARKAGYHYGWDWGPRFVSSGIWRPIIMEAWSDGRIHDVYIHPQSVSKQKATIEGQVEVISDVEGQADIIITDAANGRTYTKKAVTLTKGSNKVSLSFTLANPHLWWSNGLGEPYMYQFQTSLVRDGKRLDTQTVSTGIRSLSIVHEPDKEGHTFYVLLNGRPVFMKGADYIPMDNFLPRVTRERYDAMIHNAASCHMNMLRVWGGGIYEDDYFYDLCDRNGILVWQDFMFACSLYPAEGALLENIRQEAIDNVVRLRNHPCMALWCGNNECNDGWYNWGWKSNYEKQNPAYAARIYQQYHNTYDVVLPEVVKQYAPGTFYWPSSPYAFIDRGSNDKDGDRHYWDVWHGRKPIETYNTERSRFFSEYGFQSFPDFESVKRYAPDSTDWNIYSDVMMSHQRGGDHANKLIETYLLNEYQKPKDFESFLYMNQVLQGDAIKTAIESHRRQMPYCMGTLFWQIDDCWPVASWASIDYYGRWKAQQYYCKKAYRDLLVSPLLHDSNLLIYMVSDRMEACKGQLQVRLYDLRGHLLSERKQSVTVQPNASKVYLTLPIEEMLKGTSRSDVVVEAQWLGTKEPDHYVNHYFLVSQKNMNYPKASITHTATPIQGGYRMTLQSDVFARAVYIATGDAEATFSDNFMDLMPGQPVSIDVHTSLSPTQFDGQLKVLYLGDASIHS